MRIVCPIRFSDLLPMKLLSFLAAALATAATLIPPGTAAAAVPLDRILVVVNSGVVLQTELELAMTQARAQIRARGLQVPPDEVLRSQVLDRLILVKLQTQRANEAGIRVDDRELNEVITNIAQQNGMTLAQFADKLRKEGEDFLNVREQIRDEVLIQRIRAREVESRVSVSDQDIDLFLSTQAQREDVEYRLSHILVAVPDGASDTERAKARAKAEGILARLRAGEDFAQVAIAQSDGQQALSGGDLDWRRASDLPPLFAQTAAQLKTDETSGLLEASSGFHIVKLSGRRGGGSERQIVNETRARHILIAANAVRDDNQARALAQKLRERIAQGEKIEDLSAEYSDDPGSKNNGGDLGFQPAGSFVGEFQKALDALAPGEISAPFRTPYGWHIAQLVERRARDATIEAQRARARQAIQNRKAAEEYDTLLRRLRAEAYVEYRTKTDADASKS
jgi:peptidyl-prolyl cis-trans isomerase SurA